MNVVEIMERFPDQESCMKHLEQVRWGDKVVCPRCESEHVRSRNETQKGRIGRWSCHDCRATFKATEGTIFQGTKTPLQKWFLAISLMANAKKSLSSFQLSRDIGVSQKTCWRIMMANARKWRKETLCLRVLLKQAKPISVARDAKTMIKKKVNLAITNFSLTLIFGELEINQSQHELLRKNFCKSKMTNSDYY